MATPVRFIIYFSKAANLMTETELRSLLEQSRRNNLVHDVTGMLLYLEGRYLTNIEGRFMQLLEGPPSEVDRIFASIRADGRHSKLIVLKEGALAERLFEKWNMGFKLIAVDKEENISGFFNVDAAFLDEHVAPQKHEVLDFFRSFYTVSHEDRFS